MILLQSHQQQLNGNNLTIYVNYFIINIISAMHNNLEDFMKDTNTQLEDTGYYRCSFCKAVSAAYRGASRTCLQCGHTMQIISAEEFKSQVGKNTSQKKTRFSSK